MKLWRVLLVALLVVVMVLPLGCTGGKKTTIIVGTEATFPPFEFFDDDDKIVGFDIDVIMFIAKELGWDVKIVDRNFDTLPVDLAVGEVDVVIAGMTITAERAAQVDFSNPYYDASQVIVVRSNETRINSVEDLADMKIAVQMGTTGAYEAADIKGADDHPDLKQYQRVNEAFLALKNNVVDAVIIDEPVAKNFIAALGGMKVAGEPFTNEQFGIAVKKGNTELLEQINRALEKLVSSGEYDRLIKKWFED